MAAYFLAMYYVDTENNLRHEYLIGVSLGFLYATGFTIGSAVLAVSVKKHLSKIVFRILSMPALIIGSAFLIIYLGSIAYDLATRT